MPLEKYTVVFQPSGLRGKVEEGKTLLEAAQQLGVGLESVCGGKGFCGKCRVRLEEGYFAKYSITSSFKSVRTTGQACPQYFQPIK